MDVTKKDLLFYVALLFIAVSIQMALTDEQAHDVVAGPKGKGYMVNVATYEKSVGFASWVRVAGWSEAVVDFIKALEAEKK